MFKRYFSVSFSKYRNSLRLKKAAELLLDNKVSDVATVCGFLELSQFSAEFKEMWGISPMQYKKRELALRDKLPYEPVASKENETN